MPINILKSPEKYHETVDKSKVKHQDHMPP